MMSLSRIISLRTDLWDVIIIQNILKIPDLHGSLPYYIHATEVPKYG